MAKKNELEMPCEKKKHRGGSLTLNWTFFPHFISPVTDAKSAQKGSGLFFFFP